jgi:hypothetical protein
MPIAILAAAVLITTESDRATSTPYGMARREPTTATASPALRALAAPPSSTPPAGCRDCSRFSLRDPSLPHESSRRSPYTGHRSRVYPISQNIHSYRLVVMKRLAARWRSARLSSGPIRSVRSSTARTIWPNSSLP